MGTTVEQYRLHSPEDIATGQLLVQDNTFYAAAGSINESWNYLYNRSGVFQFREGTWTNYNGFRYPQLANLLDFITVAVDPRDQTLWAGSYGGGLLHVKSDNTFEIFKENSLIGPTIGDPTSYRVSGLAFDTDNNLWVSNYGAAQYLHLRKADGTWRSFTAPFSLPANEVGALLVDDANQVWMVAPKGGGLLVLNHNGTLDNPADDRWKYFRGGAGNGNLPSSDVLSIAKDQSGYIWVGTADGVGVIQCATEALTTPCEAVLPIAEQGGFANYLFKGEEVRSIAVDGADRKWIATRNGVWCWPTSMRPTAHFSPTTCAA
jgi:ligand-binding sensor domain-containing protein